MSTQTATILVTDLVGSTETRVRLGEERAETLRRAHDRLLAGAVGSHGGTVIKGLGDGVLASFAGAAEAVSAAVAIQRAAQDHLRPHADQALAIRIGISAGDVETDAGDCFGTPVIEASRLCAEAAGGQILVAELVRMLARGRGGHGYVPVGEMSLKGLPEPVQVSEVTWTSTPAASGVPLPLPLCSTDRFPLAGRAAPHEALAGLWKRACVEGRQIGLLAGEPGIGKTRLAAELSRTAHRDGAVVLLGRCFEDTAAPYGPFAEALRHLLAHSDPDVVMAHVDASGADLSKLVPDLAPMGPNPAPEGEPAQERARLFEAIVNVLAHTAEEAPVLLVLDDLHWADASSIELLLWIARSSRPMRLAVVGTYRDTEVDRSHPFGAALAELRRTVGVERIVLDGLDTDEVAAFLEAAGGSSLDERGRRFAALLRAETEGNPFFLGEVLVHLAESGEIVRQDDGWAPRSAEIEMAVPEGVRDVVGRRLSLLDEEANTALRAASVIGPEFDLSAVAALIGSNADVLIDVFEEPTRRRLVSDAGVDRYRFTHALVRQTLYEEIPSGRRARLHRKLADLLAEQDAATADRAHHLINSGPLGDPSLAAQLAGQAAKECRSRLAWEQAAAWYRQAVDQAEVADAGPAVRAGLLLGLGEVLNTMGDPLGARTPLLEAADAARRAQLPEILAQAAVAYGGDSGPFVDSADTAGLALLEEAERSLPETCVAMRAQVVARAAIWHGLDHDGSVGRDLATRARGLAEVSGDESALASALYSQSLFGPAGLHDRAFAAALDDLRALAAQSGNHRIESAARFGMVLALCLRGDLSAARQVASEARGWGEELQLVEVVQGADVHLRMLDIMAGRTAGVREKLEVLRVTSGGAMEIAYHGTRVHIEEWFGTADSAAEALHCALNAGIPLLGFWPIEAEMLARQGEIEEARASLRHWLEEARPRCPSLFLPAADANAAEVLSYAPDRKVAEAVYSNLVRCSGQWVYLAGACWGAVDLWLGILNGILDGYDESEAQLRAALHSNGQAGAVAFEARTALELARVLSETGRADEAAVLVRRAQDLGGSYAMPAVEARIAQLGLAAAR